MPQVRQDGLGRHRPQIELQTPRKNGDRYFLWIGRCQNKLHVRRRFFKRFKHRVKGRACEHVDFIDHEDFEAALYRFVSSLFEQRLHIVNPPVGGGI